MSEGRQLSFLEKAVRLIPGYKGYKNKEERRDNDALFRSMLASRIEKLNDVANGALAGLKGPAALKTAGGFDRLTKKLEKAADMVRFAARGYRGWFDMHKVREEELDSLYQFDVALVEDVERLEEDFGAVADAVSAGGDVQAALDNAIASLDAFSARMDSRSQLMVDLEKNTPVN